MRTVVTTKPPRARSLAVSLLVMVAVTMAARFGGLYLMSKAGET